MIPATTGRSMLGVPEGALILTTITFGSGVNPAVLFSGFLPGALLLCRPAVQPAGLPERVHRERRQFFRSFLITYI